MVAVVGCSTAPPAILAAGPQRVQVVTPLPTDAAAGTGYRIYSARADLTVNGRSATDTFGVTDLVALPDGTVFAVQDSRISVGDSDDTTQGVDRGRALVRIGPNGDATLVDSPYADRESGHDVAPACASPAGDLYAYDSADGRLVVREASGKWRAVTAPVHPLMEEATGGDGDPAEEVAIETRYGCAVASDGSVYVVDDCLLRRIDPSGVIDTVAGRPELTSGSGSGCGDLITSFNNSEPRWTALPNYDGPGREAELGWLSAVAVAPDDTVWISAFWGLQHVSPDGWIRSIGVPKELRGPEMITSLATLPDGTVLAAYGTLGPTGVASLDPDSGEWTILSSPKDPPFTSGAAPAPVQELDLYRADLATSRDHIYLGVAAGLNAGIVTVPLE